MSDNVTRFAPQGQALDNIPHMLRYWADVVERDQEKGIKTEVLVMVVKQSHEGAPSFCTFGDGHDNPFHPLYIAGMLDWCRAQLISIVEPPESRDDD